MNQSTIKPLNPPPPTSNLPGLPIPESTQYDGDTDLEGAPTTDPVNTSTQDNNNNAAKKGTINITSHTLKKKSNHRKYRCRMCNKALNSARELTIHTVLLILQQGVQQPALPSQTRV